MSHRKRSTLLLALTLGWAGTPALATNGDQMTALSAPTAAMGGATVAAPRDALTVLYNPAGLAHLTGAVEGQGIEEVRMDFGFGLLNPPRRVNGNTSDSNWYLMPTGAVAFKASDRLYFGMGMGGVSGMGVNVDDIAPAAGSQPMVTTKQVFRLSPGAAFKVNDKLTLGASLNIGYQSLALSNAQFSLPQNQQFGFGATLGAVYKMNDRIQVGLPTPARPTSMTWSSTPPQARSVSTWTCRPATPWAWPSPSARRCFWSLTSSRSSFPM